MLMKIKKKFLAENKDITFLTENPTISILDEGVFDDYHNDFVKLPMGFIDKLWRYVNRSEQSVMLYIIKKTIKFGKEYDRISLSQFNLGSKAYLSDRDNNKRYIDDGVANVSFATIRRCLNSLVKKGFIYRFTTGKGGNIQNWYFIANSNNRIIYEGLMKGVIGVSLLKQYERNPEALAYIVTTRLQGIETGITEGPALQRMQVLLGKTPDTQPTEKPKSRKKEDVEELVGYTDNALNEQSILSYKGDGKSSKSKNSEKPVTEPLLVNEGNKDENQTETSLPNLVNECEVNKDNEFVWNPVTEVVIPNDLDLSEDEVCYKENLQKHGDIVKDVFNRVERFIAPEQTAVLKSANFHYYTIFQALELSVNCFGADLIPNKFFHCLQGINEDGIKKLSKNNIIVEGQFNPLYNRDNYGVQCVNRVILDDFKNNSAFKKQDFNYDKDYLKMPTPAELKDLILNDFNCQNVPLVEEVFQKKDFMWIFQHYIDIVLKDKVDKIENKGGYITSIFKKAVNGKDDPQASGKAISYIEKVYLGMDELMALKKRYALLHRLWNMETNIHSEYEKFVPFEFLSVLSNVSSSVKKYKEIFGEYPPVKERLEITFAKYPELYCGEIKTMYQDFYNMIGLDTSNIGVDKAA